MVGRYSNNKKWQQLTLILARENLCEWSPDPLASFARSQTGHTSVQPESNLYDLSPALQHFAVTVIWFYGKMQMFQFQCFILKGTRNKETDESFKMFACI